MNTQLKEEIIDIASIIFCSVAICCFSYFAVEKTGDGINNYLHSVCESSHHRFCLIPE